MELKIISAGDKEVEFEMAGGEYTLAELLTTRLNLKKEVEFAAYNVAHPLTSSPRVYVRVSSGKALTLISETLEELRSEVAEFREALTKAK